MKPTEKANQIFCSTISPPSWDDQPELSLSNNLHLWKISIKDQMDQIDSLAKYLSPAELEKVSRYHQQKDKNRFIVGKGMLRCILSLYTGNDPAEITFESGLNDKPEILNHSLHFNVSYSNDGIIIGVSEDPIGVDIEYIHPEFTYESMLDGCFMDVENQVITSSANPRKLFYQFWTRKEALLKATSLGLGDYLKEFSCLDGGQSAPPVLCFKEDWEIRSFVSRDEYSISIAQNKARTIYYINGGNLQFIPDVKRRHL